MPETVAGFVNLIVSIFTALALVSGGLYAFKKWIRKTANEEEIVKQVRTANGGTVGSYTEKTAHVVQEIQDELKVVGNNVLESRDIAVEAKVLAQHAHNRLDAFIAGYRVLPPE
jgi:flagellar biogenesis protein FliO